MKETNKRNKENKTGLQPVSRPVEQFLGFFQKGIKKVSLYKCLKWRKNIAKMPL